MYAECNVLKINRISNLGKQPLYFLFTFLKHKKTLSPGDVVQSVSTRFEGGGGGYLVYWGLTPQQQPGSYQGIEMMMESVFWYLRQVTDQTLHIYGRGVSVCEKSTLCTLVIMMTIMDSPLATWIE